MEFSFTEPFSMSGERLFFINPSQRKGLAMTNKNNTDLSEWSHQQPTKQQDIDDLATVKTFNAITRHCGVSTGWYSIKHKNFAKSWTNFIDPPEAGMLVPA
jgi:hypothetical protein